MSIQIKRIAAVTLLTVIVGAIVILALNTTLGSFLKENSDVEDNGGNKYIDIPENKGPIKAIFPPYLYLPELSLRFPLFVERTDGKEIKITKDDVTVLLKDSEGLVRELKVIGVNRASNNLVQVWVKINEGYYAPGETIISVVIKGVGAYSDNIPLMGPVAAYIAKEVYDVNLKGGTIEIELNNKKYDISDYGIIITCDNLPRAKIIDYNGKILKITVPSGCKGDHTLMIPVDNGVSAIYVKIKYSEYNR